MCGEKKSFANSIEMELGSPPHVRGKGGVKFIKDGFAWITPACAGKRDTTANSTLKDQDHPRMCGEKFDALPLEIKQKGSPPHVRGKDG